MNRKRRILPLVTLLSMVMLLFCTGMTGAPAQSAAPALETPAGAEPSPAPEESSAPDEPSDAAEEEWALMLVNFDHPLPEDFAVPELARVRSGHFVDSRIHAALQAMLDGARAEGLQPLVCSSYRTAEGQKRLFEREVRQWRALGYIQEKAEAGAAQWVARPGTSEHQTGLAVDIVDLSYQLLNRRQENTAVQKWLMAHCAEYGFILRYPAGKTQITGVGYEPWHYRYVGVEAAREMMESGLCLEEYLAQMDQDVQDAQAAQQDAQG